MGTNHVISALRAKRAEISGHIHDLDKRVARMRANLANIDAAIRILSPETDPDAIPPKRTYRRTKYFARNELARLALDILRGSEKPLAAKEIAFAVMRAKGFQLGDDHLCRVIAKRMQEILRTYAKRGTATKIGTSRNAMWTIAGESENGKHQNQNRHAGTSRTD